jgi:hypothetical protein
MPLCGQSEAMPTLLVQRTAAKITDLSRVGKIIVHHRAKQFGATRLGTNGDVGVVTHPDAGRSAATWDGAALPGTLFLSGILESRDSKVVTNGVVSRIQLGQSTGRLRSTVA